MAARVWRCMAKQTRIIAALLKRAESHVLLTHVPIVRHPIVLPAGAGNFGV